MSPTGIETGLSATLDRTVGEGDTAEALGSGSLHVLGTPRLLAWCEAAMCGARAGARGRPDQRRHPDLARHTARPASGPPFVTASSVHVDGKLMRFSVAARQDGKLVGSGEVTRVVVNAEKFISGVAPPG